MHILVTGADGFVGSHMARGLAACGHRVTGAVFGRVAREGEVRVDLTLVRELAQLPDGIDAVVHAAGTVDPVSPARMFAVNVRATEHVLAWAERRAVQHFVHVSSVAVYGPLTLGEQRGEATPRFGSRLGLPYMRAKALAERTIERGRVPYTLLRPPAVLGLGDTVLSQGFHGALSGGGLPLLPGASPRHMVSLALAEGLGAMASSLLAHGPMNGPVHAVDVELTLDELSQRYADVLGCRRSFARISWREAWDTRADLGRAWLIASARFGQHYRRDKLVRQLRYRSKVSLESAIRGGLSGFQGHSGRIL